MTESPKVTLLMSTYNRPDYLQEAISSVISQTMTDWELILMNDGGIDAGPIVERFGDQRIRYINDPVNRGKAVRMNQGLDLARGNYVAYLDDDDKFYPNHFEALSIALDGNPDIGAAYSDLYCVQFVKDTSSGKRYPLHKFIQVSRDYNRDMMFHFNHTLHVSLMHRKDLAIHAGGYDPNVTVLIDWNITRKLSFYTDFQYVPLVTGEYYIPIADSDRISNLQRKDPERFKHNLRKIKGNLPPEPWPKVRRVGVVLPVTVWNEDLKARLTDFIDHIDYPVRWALVNNTQPPTPLETCQKSLDHLSELKNVKILTPSRPLTLMAAYGFGAQALDVDYLYLPSEKANPKMPFRLISALPFLDQMGKRCLKWDTPDERNTQTDLIIKRNRFLKLTQKSGANNSVRPIFLNGGMPETLKADLIYTKLNEKIKGEDYKSAFDILKQLERLQQGAPSSRVFVDNYVRVCSALKYYDLAEEKCRQLIKEGCGGNNWILLGKILQSRKEFTQAADAYRKAIAELGLDLEELLNPAFRHVLPEHFGIVAASLGLGECMIETGDLVEASKVFRRAARVKPDSPRPFLGFASIFMKAGDLAKARQAISDLFRRRQESAETYLLLGMIEEKENRLEKAFEAMSKALSLDPRDPDIQTALFNAGKAMGRWQETLEVLENAFKQCPASIHCIQLMAEAAHAAGRVGKACELLKKGVALMPGHEKLHALLEFYGKNEAEDIKDSVKPQYGERPATSPGGEVKEGLLQVNSPCVGKRPSAVYKACSTAVSVGLPVYNGGKYLAEAIESILSQDFSDFELIISDNCSNDKTPDICMDYAKKDSRIRYFRCNTNIGIARNFFGVLGLAISPYFMWASHDDLRERSFIGSCLKAFDDDNAISLVYPLTRLLTADSRPKGIVNEDVKANHASKSARFCSMIWKIGLCNMFYGVYRTAQLKNLTAWDYNDIPFLDNLILAEISLTGRIVLINEVLFIRRLTRDYNYDSPDSRYLQLISELNPRLIYDGISLPYCRFAMAHIEIIQKFGLSYEEKEMLIKETIRCFKTRYGQLLDYEIKRLKQLVLNKIYFKTWDKASKHIEISRQSPIFRNYIITNLLKTMKDAVFLFPEDRDLFKCYNRCIDELKRPIASSDCKYLGSDAVQFAEYSYTKMDKTILGGHTGV